MFTPAEVLRLGARRLTASNGIRGLEDFLSDLAGGSKNIPKGRPSGDCITTPEAPDEPDLAVALEKYSDAGVVSISPGVGRDRCSPWSVRTRVAADEGYSPSGDRAF
jgi:hypothetical protein